MAEPKATAAQDPDEPLLDRALLGEVAAASGLPPARLRRTLAALPEPGRVLLGLGRVAGGLPPAAWPGALSDVSRFLAFAPSLTPLLTTRPALLAPLVAGRLGAEPLAPRLAGPGGDAAAVCRRWLAEARLGLAWAILAGRLDAAACGGPYTAIAEAIVEALHDAVTRAFREDHGEIAGARFAVLALGKLGGREMTAGSDLDLVLVHDADAPDRRSDGPRPLPAQAYFARLAHALLAALTAREGAETLYEIDMRLSPWARKSAAIVHLDGFRRYHAEDAWTWEHMALTRARPVAGDAGLGAELAGIVDGCLRRRRDGSRLLRDVAEMRRRIARHRAPEPPFDPKHRPGGLLDCEFAVQFLMLREAARRPEVLARSSAEAVGRLAAAGVLGAADAAALGAGIRLWQALTCLGRLTGGMAEAEARRREALRLAGADEAALAETAAAVGAVYERLIAAPAAAA